MATVQFDRDGKTVTATVLEGNDGRYSTAPSAWPNLTEIFVAGKDGHEPVGLCRKDDGESVARMVDDHASGRSAARSKQFWDWFNAYRDQANPEVVAAAVGAGFELDHTGGGCTAWTRPTEDGGRLMVVTEDATADGDPHAEEWSVSRYGVDDEGWVSAGPYSTLFDALATCVRLPAPVDADGEVFEHSFETLEAAEEWAAGSRANPDKVSRGM